MGVVGARIKAESKAESNYVRLLNQTVEHFPTACDMDDTTWLIGVSGGVSSSVLLDMALVAFPNYRIVPFHQYLIPGLDITGELERRINRRYNLPLVTMQCWRGGDGFIANGQVRLERWLSYNYSHGNLDNAYIGYGYKACDSARRRVRLMPYRFGVDKVNGTFAPLKDWTEADVVTYMRENRLPVPESWEGVRVTSGNLVPSPHNMAYLKDNWPGDYAKVLKVWPGLIGSADKYWRWRSGNVRKRQGRGGTGIGGVRLDVLEYDEGMVRAGAGLIDD